MSRIYVASTLTNAENARAAAEKLEAAGHSITYKWFEHGAVGHLGKAKLREVAEKEESSVSDATVLVLLLPGGKGSHYELGYFRGWYDCAVYEATGAEARAFVVDPTGAAFQENDQMCAFYWTHEVEQVRSVEEVIAALNPYAGV